ncbi:MAG TPA: hypothetical protein VFR81_09760 [Longimicrobium sp.]|nr:hypothetical protein [Longimicrobium sp.]
MMEERGLFKFAALLLIGLLVLGGLGWIIGGDESAEAAPVALRDQPRADDAPPAPAQEADAPAAAADAVCVPGGGLKPLDAEIHESSGVAVSRAHAGIFWTHNDSGEPLLYAVDSLGHTAGRVRVTGAAVEDWEDVSLAPCPGGGDCLYVADIGDNDAARPAVTVYRFPEPAPGAGESAPATAIRLRYPDGAQDAEAMFVLDGAIHVVTKGESGPIAVYRAPADAAAGAALERVRQLSPGKVDRPERITSADASADGRWIAVRTLRSLAIYPAAELTGSGEAAPRRVDLKALDEAQGEGLGFTPDGSILLTSEGGKKDKPATFARLSCTLR